MIAAHTVCDLDIGAEGVGGEMVMQLVEPSE